jgi:PAS domain S-box-containing protein
LTRRSSVLASLRRWLDLLTRPSPLLDAPFDRQQARLLASLSLALILIEAVTAPIGIRAMPAFTSAPLLAVGMLLLLIAVYALSRTRHYQYGAFMLVMAFLLFVLFVLLLVPLTGGERLLVLKYLVFVLMLSSLFLPRIATLVYLIISFAMVIAFFFVPDVPFIHVFSYLIFFILISILGTIPSVTSTVYRAQLMESEARYRSVVSALSEGVVMLGRDGAILTSNESAAQILGLTVEQMVGRTSFDPRWQAVHEDGTPFPGETHPAIIALRTGEPQSNVVMGVRRPDDELVWIVVSARPLIRAGDTQPYAVVASFTDITEMRKAQQQQFEIAIERERVALLTQFVQNAAHEFRTPLGIINTSSYLMARSDDRDKRMERQAQIEREVYRISRLVDMMLTLVKLESQPLTPTARIDVHQFLRSLCAAVFREGTELPALHLDIPDNQAVILGDLPHLTEAFQQILENAARFTPLDGSVTVCSRAADGTVWVQIEDTGAGIALDKLPHIFDSFWREDQAHTTPGFGWLENCSDPRKLDTALNPASSSVHERGLPSILWSTSEDSRAAWAAD